MSRMAVLTYHSQNILGNDYASNDHVALRSDLAELRRRGIRIVSLNHLVDALISGDAAAFPAGTVALSCDDGTVLDWFDYHHPEWGWQPGFDRLLRDHMDDTGTVTEVITAFLIASPQARADIDAGCYGGAALSTSSWWAEAADSGRFYLGNHSWDHAHACLRELADTPALCGNFHMVTDAVSADRQLRQAGDFIAAELGTNVPRPRLFAYPYGHATDYLVHEYLPKRRAEHGIDAAFTTEPAYVTPTANRFRLPRFVCGDAWRSSEEFGNILDSLLLI